MNRSVSLLQQNLKNYSHEVVYREIGGETLENCTSRYNLYSIFFIEKGEGEHIIENIVHTVRPYQIHLVFPGQKDEWKINNKSVKIHLIEIMPEILDVFSCYLVYSLAFYKQNPLVKPDREDFYRLLYEVQGIRSELQIKRKFWDIIYSRLRLITFMIGKEATKLFADNHKKTASHLLIRFLVLVLGHFRQERTVAFYADQLAISPNYLNILCKRYFDKRAIEIINNELLLEIKNSLILTDKPIKEIAYEFNFKDLPSFSTFFKRNSGITPRDFVKISKNNE